METKGDLTRAERLEIGILLRKGYSQRSIGTSLGRSPNTISYEIRENSVAGVYEALKADAKARLRKRMRRLEWSKIEQCPTLKIFIVAKLRARWNPDEIAGFLKRTKAYPYVSKTAIYAWLRTSRGERYCAYQYSKRKRIRKRKPKAHKIVIPNRIGIERRFQSATNRSRYGHWERDSLVSRRGGRGGVAVHIDRKSRLVLGRKVHGMSPREHAEATQHIENTMVMKSTTMDNGFENRDHESWGMPTFACDPYSSWQKVCHH